MHIRLTGGTFRIFIHARPNVIKTNTFNFLEKLRDFTQGQKFNPIGHYKDLKCFQVLFSIQT